MAKRVAGKPLPVTEAKVHFASVCLILVSLVPVHLHLSCFYARPRFLLSYSACCHETQAQR